MKKLVTLFLVCMCFAFAANAQPYPELGTPGVTLDPLDVPMFENDLPVIKELGLRVNLAKGKKGTQMIEVSMEETFQDVLGMNYQTMLWGYKFPGLPATYPGATIVANKDKPVTIRWKNDLPGHFLPVDPTMHMAHPSNLHNDVEGIRNWYASGNVPTVAHLHGGHTESASDGLPEQWYTQDRLGTLQEKGAYFEKQEFTYHNDQEAATLWYHDHALGITRLNVHAGLAGFYLLRDDNEEMLIEKHILPDEDYEIEIVIQDRLFDMAGQLFWPAFPGEVPYEDFIETPLPELEFPNGGPTALAEFFGNIILVNGKAWPKLEVEPRKYRFRLLNGSDSRFYVLKLDNSQPIMIIGTDDGLLEQPVFVDELEFAPGERYDVVVDFTDLEDMDITMINLGPDEPYGGGVPGVDYTSSNPETTGKIMQFQVTKDFEEKTQKASVKLGTKLNSIVWPEAENSQEPRQVVLFEGKDEHGRLQPMLGTMDEGSLTWSQPTTENPQNNSTELWEVYNATGDAHPIHLHLVKFQVLNRQEFTFDIEEKVQPQHNGSTGKGFRLTAYSLVGGLIEPAAYEKGWKDTFIVPPGQVGRLVAHFDRPGRYVWHCHILSHEDHEMMRVLHVGPIPQPSIGKKKGAAVEDQLEPDQFGDFRLYPNPASDRTIVDFVLEESAEVRVSIYGFDGKIINSEELGALNDGTHSIEVPVGHLDNGMYIFELKAGNKQFRESMIISK